MSCVIEPEIDQPTADLIITLQLQDAGFYFDSSKGKTRDPTDEEVAFQLQNEELQKTSQVLLDKRMATSIAAAVRTDGRILADNQVEEENVVKDREIARHWTGDGSHVTAEDPHSKTESTLDDETLEKLQFLYVSGLEDYDSVCGAGIETEQAESSTLAAKQTRQSPSRMRRCVACTEETEFFNVMRAPCHHEYCRPCLENLFEAAMVDESLFPPRCCRQPIVMNVARIFLNSELMRRFEKKKLEFETPNRTYCYSPTCSAFIHPSRIEGEVATCPDCGSITCTSCKARGHTGDCPNDSAMQQLLTTAQASGWQRCYSCWRLVELDHGCNHMT